MPTSLDLGARFPGARTALTRVACAGGGAAGALRLARAAARWRGAPEITVAALGGSYPHGCDCDSPLWPLPALWRNYCNANCSWPGRVADWLRAALPGARVAHADLAVPASGVAASVANLPALLAAAGTAPGLLLVDHSANDAVLNSAPADLLAAYEALVAGARARAPHLELVFVLGCTDFCARANEVVAAVASAHGVPLVSHAAFAAAALALARPQDGAPPPTPATYFSFPEGTPHPTWEVHALVGELVAGCVADAVEASCSGGVDSGGDQRDVDDAALAGADAVALTAGCASAPWLDANAARAAGAAAGTSAVPDEANFALAEDRPGKWGWISTSSDSRASFHARFSDVGGRVIVTYLRSYEGLARAAIFIGTGGAAVELDGRWPRGSTADVARVSQLDVASIDAAAWPHEQQRGVDFNLTFTVIPGAAGEVKFRIAAVQVC